MPQPLKRGISVSGVLFDCIFTNPDIMEISLNRITNLSIIVAFTIALLYLGKPILVPLAFSFFLSMLLYPVARFLEKIGIPRIVAIILVFLGVVIVVAGTMFFFGTQFYHLFQNIKDFGKNLGDLLSNGINYIDQHILTGKYQLRDIYGEGTKNLLGSTNIIEKTLTSSTSFFASLALVIVFTFLFLLYRGSFKELIILHFREGEKEEAAKVVNTIQKVAQNYFFGLILVVMILGTLNGTGLLIIGLDYPYLFGYFAALLAVIPYIGTFIGGLLPTLYALINYDSLWMPMFVMILYVSVQVLEGNVLTPKIVGSKVSLNPLFALIALFIGSLIWGVAGMILFIPMMAIIKVLFDNIDGLRPYGILLSSHFGDQDLNFMDFRKKISGKFGKTPEQK